MPLISFCRGTYSQKHTILEYSKTWRFWSTPETCVFGVLQIRSFLEWSSKTKRIFGGVVFFNTCSRNQSSIFAFSFSRCPPISKCNFRVLQHSAVLEYSKIVRFWSTPKSCLFGVLQNRSCLEYECELILIRGIRMDS